MARAFASRLLRPAGGQRRPAGDGAAPPRVLVVDGPGMLRTVADVFRELRDLGAELVLTGRYSEAGRPSDVPDDLARDRGVRLTELPLVREGGAETPLALFRATATALWALDPALETASMARARSLRRFRKWLRVGLERAGQADVERFDDLRDETVPLGTFAAHPAAYAGLRLLFRDAERLLPPPDGLPEAIAAVGADAVFILSRCSHGGVEPDVIKAARAAGVPTVLLVWSWDNLSSKSVLNEHPDLMLVWNERQVEEAVRLHGVPRERVAAVGAANFDGFFDELGRLGAERAPRRPPTVLYLGSSPNVAPDEPTIFARWLSALRSHDDEVVAAAPVVVRPHPGKEARWEGRVDPPNATLSMPGRGATLAELLLRADAVVALNTSAELEAAIAGRPVLTFRAGDEAPGQEGSYHFGYLLAANGGFVSDARDLSEHLVRLGAVLRGEDDPATRAGFVERFVRPRGLERRVSPIVAETVLEAARRHAGASRTR